VNESGAKTQRKIDAKARRRAREIVATQGCRTLKHANQFAENWIVTAMQMARNAAYWEDRCRKAGA
jgi:hypothetical protein